MRRSGLVITCLLSITFLSSCEDKKEADLYKAQLCIDKATAASVNDCLNFISGDNSKRAAVLRCSAAFISENIDETAIVNALENIDGQSSGNPTTPAIAALQMSSTTVASQAVSTCAAADSEALTALANFANIATSMSALAGFPSNPTPSSVEAWLSSYSGTSGTDTETLGNAIIASQDSLCNSQNGLFKDQKACTDINAAITAGGGNPVTVANQLLQNIK